MIQAVGWRVTFFLCGAFGVLCAIVFFFTVREPARTGAKRDTISLWSTLKFLITKRSFAAAAAGGAIANFATNSNYQYMVSFMMRAHEMPVAVASSILGVAIGGIGIFTTLVAGPIIDRSSRRFPNIRTWLPAAGLVWCGIFYVLAFQVDAEAPFIVLLIAASLGQHFYTPALYAVAQDIAPPHMRATAAALMIAIISLVGYGLGPPLIGLMSDVLGQLAMTANGTSAALCADVATEICKKASADGLRLSLSIGSATFVLAGVLFALSGKTIERDIYRQ
jgi:predicted MFS family arabinose efflux permease